ncbi:PREDICTED: glucosamine-6-phosphate isomerase 1 [Hipposideros armiger]|uniref:Glucosamine-6-phosphate isomerase 1 n=1 Tax=Hipposideros armiger TaxID=186990 RepID=A0A8B7T0P7_HIPAR|nr:PREDICTED: glucosamine-6-phosphate isomerase 1 [Hipposideros armiger]XP_019518649.1 PREDICTED: glucosamine-6-phosphate isomerase 1 [Hipposideros armiger]XP_019518659.1 PREDICTED: glucosamine-6-phosphate isomerase 1 [Hipposideros armiger]
MKLIILDHYSQASEWAAKYIRNRIIQFNPGPDKYFTLGLPTGSTPLGCYKKLIEYYKNGDLSFKYVKTFNMDEYVGTLGGELRLVSLPLRKSYTWSSVTSCHHHPPPLLPCNFVMASL